MTTIRRQAAVAIGVAAFAMTCGCAASDDKLETWTVHTAPVTPLPWSPHYIDPARCSNNEPVPSKPPDAGYCDIEIVLGEMTFSNGQGASEGKGELRGSFTAYPLDVPPGTDKTVAVMPGQDYSVGQSENSGAALGTYRVAVGDTRDIQVCASIVEDDRQGANGQDDWASPCTVITLSCDAQTGQPAFDREVGSALCEADGSCNGAVTFTIEVMATDADDDNIPNADDFTPELCDEELKGTAGIAALIYFHYDDNGLITLGQSVWTNLSQVYGAYDYVVLVSDNASSNPLNTSGAAWSGADRVFPPTRAGILDAMQHLTAEGYRFDTFVHAHGYKVDTDDSGFEDMDPCVPTPNGSCWQPYISGAWLESVTEEDDIGTARGGVPIIAWWSTTCIAVRQIDSWKTVGAITVSGAVDVQFFPNAWGNFVSNWIGGQTYKAAVDNSVTAGVQSAATTVVNAQGAVPPWNCNAPGMLVVEDNTCADNFFNDTDGSGPDEAKYNISAVYDDSKTGFENMVISSTRTFMGSHQITFGAANHNWP